MTPMMHFLSQFLAIILHSLSQKSNETVSQECIFWEVYVSWSMKIKETFIFSNKLEVNFINTGSDLSCSSLSYHYPVIIAINSSKSSVPDLSPSTSSMMPLRSSSVSLLSSSLRISLRVSVEMEPTLSLS